MWLFPNVYSNSVTVLYIKDLNQVYNSLNPLRFKAKENVLRKAKLLKGTDIFINKDYCKDTVEYRKEL